MNYLRKTAAEILGSDPLLGRCMLVLGPCVHMPVDEYGRLGIYRSENASWVIFRAVDWSYIDKHGTSIPLTYKHSWGPL